MRWCRLPDLGLKLIWTYVRFEGRNLMPKKFRNYVIKGQEHVDRKTGKTIPSPSVWRSVKDVLPETPTDDTACLYYVKLKDSEKSSCLHILEMANGLTQKEKNTKV